MAGLASITRAPWGGNILHG